MEYCSRMAVDEARITVYVDAPWERRMIADRPLPSKTGEYEREPPGGEGAMWVGSERAIVVEIAGDGGRGAGIGIRIGSEAS
jgi:hypothetical protein